MPSLSIKDDMAAASSYNPEAPCLIPKVRPSVNRSVTRKDASPFPIGNQSNENACRICQANEARYTCPRCEVPYCSVDCYKQHDGPCTEAFYQERVSSVLKLEAKDSSQSLNTILNRSHRLMNSETSTLEESTFSEQELYMLAKALEQSSLQDETIESLITPEIQSAFERAVRKGELSHVVESWHPWWMPELMSASHDETPDTPLRHRKTLDERLLAVPSFWSFSSSASPLLSFNLLDILSSITATLRLYHGVDNAISNACPDAAYTLLSFSGVLREDSRYSSVTEALISFTETLSANQGSCGNGIHRAVVVEDVALLCDKQYQCRFLGRAFLEAIDIIKAAIKCMKRQAEDTTVLRRARKKLEFYLSWSQEAELPLDLSNQVREWINDWKRPDENENIEMLRLPNNTNQLQCTKPLSKVTGKTEEPHLVEVQSTRTVGEPSG